MSHLEGGGPPHLHLSHAEASASKLVFLVSLLPPAASELSLQTTHKFLNIFFSSFFIFSCDKTNNQ